jgi:hypothetical protein
MAKSPTSDPPKSEEPSLRVVALKGRERPAPPPKLSRADQELWRGMVDAAPGGWLDIPGQLLLKRVIALNRTVERHEARLQRMATMGGSLEDELLVSKAHQNAVKSLTAALTALRVTPKSRAEPKIARTAFERSSGPEKPWNITADAIEVTADDNTAS